MKHRLAQGWRPGESADLHDQCRFLSGSTKGLQSKLMLEENLRVSKRRFYSYSH